MTIIYTLFFLEGIIMKRNICILLSLLLLILTVFTACFGSSTEEETTEETTEEVTTEEKPTDAANPIPSQQEDETAKAPATEVPVTEAPTTKADPVTQAPATEAPTEAVTYPSGPQIIGVSSKGYDIVQEDGFTYVNGILIANKTYSLPSDYYPGGLLNNCSAAFREMQAAAAEEGLDIYISSGFRSYSTQASIYNRYCSYDGQAAADRYSARPGHSEHQTGLAIDLNTIEYSFAYTAEGKWVAENCWKYGFILRYPENKEAQTGYRYEPWHIRYIGVNNATAVYNSGLCLEEYLGITSAY